MSVRTHTLQIATASGLTILCLWAATQWAAAVLAYQPALGSAWIQFAGIKVYAPWQLSSWWLAFDAQAPDLFARAGIVAAVGGLLSGAPRCDRPLFGGVEPKLGDQHLRVLTVLGFPNATVPGLLDALNDLGFAYRWTTRWIALDKTEATRHLTRLLADFHFRTVEKLRFADTDQNGHVTNSVFAICCQNARMELLCDPKKVPLPSNAQFVIARLLLEFRAEMRWPGAVEVGTRVDHVGRSSVTLAQALFVDERCVAIADSIMALMDKTSRRSILLPDAAAQALRAFSCLSPNGPSRAAIVVNCEDERSE